MKLNFFGWNKPKNKTATVANRAALVKIKECLNKIDLGESMPVKAKFAAIDPIQFTDNQVNQILLSICNLLN